MDNTNEMIPVCGEFALESFTSCLGEESTALEGAIADAKDSVATKIGNMKDAILDKIKKTSKGKDADALKKDKEHILKEQAKVANAAKESKVLLRGLKAGTVTPEEFPAKFKEATEAVRVSKAMVGIGSESELTLQDLQDYTEFLSEAGNIIDQAIAGLMESATATATEAENADNVGGIAPVTVIDESAIEGVWNCAYSAYERNYEIASEGLNIVRKPLTKQEFQAVFNQERVREDENLRNAIAHGKYTRTELVDMGLLKEDSDRLGKGEYEQLLVDYEKELKEMKEMDKDARLEYVKKHKLPRHLIHCFNKEGFNSYEDFIKSAKDEKGDKKTEKKAEEGYSDTAAEEAAKVGNYTIVSKPEDLEDEEEKQEKMPEEKKPAKAPKAMNKAHEAFELSEDELNQLDEIINLGDEAALAAIEALVDSMDADEDLGAFEGKAAELKDMIAKKFAAIKDKQKNEAPKIENEIKEIYERIKQHKDDIEYGDMHKGIRLMRVPQAVRADINKIIAIFEKLQRDDQDKFNDPDLNKIYAECSKLFNEIEASDDAYADPALAGVTEPTDAENSTNDEPTDIDDAVKRFAAQANIVKEHLMAIKPVYAKDRNSCIGSLEKILKELENLLPYASEITTSDEKIKAYDYIAQQRAALQKALDNIPADISNSEKAEAEKDTKTDMVAVEASGDDEPKSTECDSAAEQTAEAIRNLIERNRKNIVAMRNSDNKDDDSLATVAIQLRSQALSLKASASEDDRDDLEDVISTCSRFIARYGKAIDK